MHEVAPTQTLLEIALRQARAAQAQRITEVFLVLGEDSTLADESIQFYWGLLSQDTPAAGARLHFRRVPGSEFFVEALSLEPARAASSEAARTAP